MITGRMNRAFEALTACRSSVPDLRHIYRPGTPQRAALDRLLAALSEVETEFGWQRTSPGHPEY